MDDMEIFLAAIPGLEPLLAAEAAEAGFATPCVVPGGVTTRGGWAEVARANRTLRGAGRVLARIATFRAFHLAQLDKRARKVDWAAVLLPGTPVRVEATCHASKIYHAGAAAQRVSRAIEAAIGAPAAVDTPGSEPPEGETAVEPLRFLVRIDDDLVTVSLDTSGAPLHRRGMKTFVGKAPLRETQAALFLRACGWDGTTPLVDPMCGSGTILLEAAAIAAGLPPGRARGFAFERLACAGQAAGEPAAAPAPSVDMPAIQGHDRDDGAVRGARANAERAGVADYITITRQAISDLVPPQGPPGLVLVNPPYGARIGAKGPLHGLYASLGAVLRDRFRGWQAGIVTSAPELARTTGLDFAETGPPVPHGPLRIRLYRSGPLP